MIEFICKKCHETYCDEDIPKDEICPECGGELEFFECY
jgi:PHP family Zn ribbon phosphoesterase